MAASNRVSDIVVFGERLQKLKQVAFFEAVIISTFSKWTSETHPKKVILIFKRVA